MSDLSAIVDINAGKIEGDYQDGLYVFKGIPYAAPPVKELRWLPPQPVDPWEGTLQAKEYSPMAPQNVLMESNLDALKIEGPQSEDCLYLNIWTPGLDDKKRPVMVWIHGGAFIIGAGSQPTYDGAPLTKRGDVVIVIINYRLGALGFMNLKEITNGKIPATGNEGLLDQIAAIEWVRNNITSFGGNPDNVTIFGESAGGMSIGCLLSMPAAMGKFHKAILESGAANTVSSLDVAKDMSSRYLEILGVNPDDIEALRSFSFEQLLKAQQELGDKIRETTRRVTPFQPVVDGEAIPELPIEAIQKGCAKGVKVIAGTNLEEWKLFGIMDLELNSLDDTGLIKRLEGFLDSDFVPQLIETYRQARINRGDPVSPKDILTAINTDMMFRIPATRLVQAQCDNGQPAYNYLFTWKSPLMGGVLGSCHALEIGFVFGKHDEKFCGSGPDADLLSRNIQDAWLAFARAGDPTCESMGEWKPYCDGRMTMILDKECRLKEAPYDEERSVWDSFKSHFRQPI